MSPTLAEVTAASAAWVWLPDFAVTVETDEYLVVRYPDWFEEPLMLTRLRPRRPAAVVVDEVLERARDLGPREILCWVPPDAAPGVEALLAERGTPAMTVDVLARDLTSGGPGGSVPVDVEPLLCRGGSVSITADANPFCVDLVDPTGQQLQPGDSLVVRVTGDEAGAAYVSQLVLSFRSGLQVGEQPAGTRAVVAIVPPTS